MHAILFLPLLSSNTPDTDPNSGLVLWFQQFCAIFLKRFYNSLRFWQAIITQLILPLLFVLFALILAVTLPNFNENDPPRALTVENSALDGSSRFLFYAEFGAEPKAVFDFEVSSLLSTSSSLLSSLLPSFRYSLPPSIPPFPFHIALHRHNTYMYMYIYVHHYDIL